MPFPFFFKYPSFKILLKQKETSLTPLGVYGKYPSSERGKGLYLLVLLQLKKKAGNSSSILLQSRHFRSIVSDSVLFSCLLNLLTGSYTLVLISQDNFALHLAHKKYLNLLTRTTTVFP